MTTQYADVQLSITESLQLSVNDRIYLAPGSPAGTVMLTPQRDQLPAVGSQLAFGAGSGLRVRSLFHAPAAGEQPCSIGMVFDAVTDLVLPKGEISCPCTKEGFSVAWIILSDKGSRGEREDKCGPLIADAVRQQLDLSLMQGYLIPDDEAQLRQLLSELAHLQKFDLILTSGGTGVGPRDISPEATLKVLDKRLPGYERAMTLASLQKTPHGAISRAVAGTIAQSLVVNLPGSPKAVAENLEAVLPTLKHTMEKLQGDPSDCARL